MTEKQIEVLMAFADNNMNIRQTAEAIHVDRTSVQYHLERVQAKTGLDPKKFHELNELLQMVGSTPKKSDAKVYKKVCSVCGREFYAPSNRFQICSDECRAVNMRAAQKRQTDANRAEREDYRRSWTRRQPGITPSVFPGLSLPEVNAKAKAAGMSYGKYVAQMRYA